jgi:hypothetical protein
MPGIAWPSGLEAAADAAHPIVVEDAATSSSGEAGLLSGNDIKKIRKLSRSLMRCDIRGTEEPQFAAHRSLRLLSTRRQWKISVCIYQGPLRLEIRTQCSTLNDSCLKYRSNQELAQREWGEAGGGRRRLRRGFELRSGSEGGCRCLSVRLSCCPVCCLSFAGLGGLMMRNRDKARKKFERP